MIEYLGIVRDSMDTVMEGIDIGKESINSVRKGINIEEIHL